MPYSPTQRIAGIFAWFIVCLAAYLVCTAFFAMRVVGENSWYELLNKPDWTPSVTFLTWAWFGVFNTSAIAVWHIWIQREEPMSRLAVKFFVATLVLLAIWMMIYFGFMNPYCGLIQVIIVWMACMATTSLFWQRSRLAGAMLLPAFLWITFSGYLNFAIWQLNA